MIVLRYSRFGAAAFVSHIDVLRQTSRILRRAEIPVKFSQGFNPHALVFFSPPTPVGVASAAEYVAVDTSLSAGETLARYNASVTADMHASAAFDVPTNPNLAGRITAADYVFPFAYTTEALKDGLTLEYEKKGVKVTENAAEKVYSVFSAGGRLGLRAAAGNVTLRADRVFAALNKKYGAAAALTDTIKTAQYVTGADGVCENVDLLLSRASCAAAYACDHESERRAVDVNVG